MAEQPGIRRTPAWFQALTSDLTSRIIVHLWFIFGLVLVGTVGYMCLEHWTFLEALFMTVTTLTTVGYGEVHQLDTIGRIYTIVLILFGVGLLIYILSDMAEIVVEANPSAFFGRRRMKEAISRLTEHQIVCGYGRTGQEVCRLFKRDEIPFVVIEMDIDRVKLAEVQGCLVMEGDATSDDDLNQARIRNAAGIVCALSDDAANTFITLAARELNEKIKIVCRAANPGSEAKMLRAGANSVISPYIICGRRMATAVAQPLVLELLDVAMNSPDLKIDQISVTDAGQLVGNTLKEANIKKTVGAMVLAVSRGGKLITNPPPDLVFQSDDILIVLGADKELKTVGEMAHAKAQ